MIYERSLYVSLPLPKTVKGGTYIAGIGQDHDLHPDDCGWQQKEGIYIYI